MMSRAVCSGTFSSLRVTGADVIYGATTNDTIDLSGDKVKSVKEEDDLTTIQLADKSVFGSAKITMMFDPKSYDLRQWTITDAQGKDTTVMIYNTKEGVSFPADTFAIDYAANRELNTKTR